MNSERNVTLGELLRQEREKRGITIEQMASATRVGIRFLHALESDHYAELPAKPFVRGFVTAYARFLNLDSQELLTRFGTFIDQKSLERPNREAGHSGYAFESKEGEQSRTGLWILMGVMVVVGSIGVALFKPSGHGHKRTHADRLREAHQAAVVPSAAPVAVGAEKMTSPSPMPVPAPALPSKAEGAVAQSSPSPSPSVTPVGAVDSERRPDPLNSGKDLLKTEIRFKVVVKAVEDLWVRYQLDQKPVSKLILRQGITLVLLAKEVISFQVSDPKAALVTVSEGEPGSLKATAVLVSAADLLAKFKSPDPASKALIVPSQVAETKGNLFKGERPLTPPPASLSRAASPSPSPTP